MTLVDAETGEIVPTLAEHEAVIERGLGTFVEVGNALIAIRDGRLYRLTHDTFEDYCLRRWGLKRQRAYQLITASEVAASVSQICDTPVLRESHATALAPLKQEPARMADALRNAGPQPTAERIREAVKEIVREETAKAKQEHEDRQALGDLARMAEQAGMDMDEDRQAQRGAFARLCRDLAALPRPSDFLHAQHGYLRPRHRTGAQAAHDWLSELLAEWEEQ